MTTVAEPLMDIEIHDPATDELVGRVRPAGQEQVDDAVGRAVAAAPGWARTAPGDRAGAVKEAALALRGVADELARLNETETGRPYDDALGGVLAAAGTLEQYAELGPLHRGRSLQGSWSATDLMVPEPLRRRRRDHAVERPGGGRRGPHRRRPGHRQHRGAQALRALPAPRAPLRRPRRLVPARRRPHRRRRRRAHRAPCSPGTPGSTSWRTSGRIAAGRAIAEAAVGTGAKVLLENGGNDPLIVDDGRRPGVGRGRRWRSAPTPTAARSACRWSASTATPRSPTTFLAALAEEATRWVYRPSAEGEKALGPLVDRRQREHVHSHVAAALEAGATAPRRRGDPGRAGRLLPARPWSAAARPTCAILREETFGPVAAVRVVDSLRPGPRRGDRRPPRPRGHGAHPRHGARPGGVAGAARRHREDQRRVRRGARAVPREPRGLSGTGFGYGPELLDEMTTTKVVHIEPCPTRDGSSRLSRRVMSPSPPNG